MAGLRKCKECGKLFLPKGREQYCSEDHFRPCPICGTPVIVTYFSDPPRKCDNCKHKKTSSSHKATPHHTKQLFKLDPESSVDSISDTESTSKSPRADWHDKVDTAIQDLMDTKAFCNQLTGETRVYIGPELKNLKTPFLKGHEYTLKVEKHDQVYWVTGEEDCTTGEDVHIIVPYTSQLSINQNFARIKESVMQN